MPRRWTQEEESKYRKELNKLYVLQNKTIKDVGIILGIAEQTVFQRLKRLDILVCPERKRAYSNKRNDITIPSHYSEPLAEFLGIMLGDGSLSHFQVVITLGSKELAYAVYVCSLIKNIFGIKPKIGTRKTGHRDVYFGSVDVTRWLLGQGLVYNKVKFQVDVPKNVFKNKKLMSSFVRGFFDTDGTIYKLKYGVQISLTNRSFPLLRSLHKMLVDLQYKPSRISGYNIYITRKNDIQRFFREIKPKNLKHVRRFKDFSAY